MKACEQYIDLIMRSIDGETDGQEETALRVHLMACPGCKALYESYRAIDDGICLAEEEPPASLTNAIMNSVHRDTQQYQPKSWLKRGRFTAIAAAAAVLLLMVTKFGGSFETPDVGMVYSAPEQAVAEAAMPEVAAEFRSGGVPAAAEEVPEEAKDVPEVQMLEPPFEANTDTAVPEIPIAEPTEIPEENYTGGEVEGGKVFGDHEDALQELLERAGCSGKVLVITDATAEALEALFSEVHAVTLENGLMAYEIASEYVQTRVEDGTITVVDSFLIGDETDSVWLVLK